MPVDPEHGISRRQLLLLAGAGVAIWPLQAGGGGEFWNKKAPAEWSSAEIDRLITKSPWAKTVKAQYATGGTRGDGGGYPGGPGTGTGTGGGYPGGGYPGGGTGRTGGGYPGGGYPGGGYPGGTGRTRGGIGIPGIGGIGIPGIGGRGRGNGNGGSVSPYEGTVRWESARPVLDAMKAPLPEAFEGRYVISVSGIPLMGGGRSTGGGEDDDSTSSRRREQEELEPLKELTSLQVKGRDLVQAGVVARQIGTGSSFLFGFSKEMLTVDSKDAEILFRTQLGRLLVKASFLPKEMLYHGELAV